LGEGRIVCAFSPVLLEGHFSAASSPQEVAMERPRVQTVVLVLALALPSGMPVSADVNGMCTDEIVIGRNRDGGVAPNQDMRWTVIGDAAAGFGALTEAGSGWGGFRETRSLAVGDIDGDGLDEVIVGRDAGLNERYFVFDDATAGFAELQAGGSDWGIGRAATAIAAGNVDADAALEFAVGRNGPNGFRYRIYDDAANGFEAIHTGGDSWPNDRDVTALAFGDVDGDGLDELVVGRTGGATQRPRWIVVDDAAAGFAEMLAAGDDWGDERSVTALATGDVDNDGRDEIVVGRSAGANMRWEAFDDADAGFASILAMGVSLGDDRSVTALALGDVDGDGIDELLVGLNGGAGPRVRLLDDALRDFAVITDSGGAAIVFDSDTWGAERSATAVAFGDVDGDAVDEVVIGRSQGANARWLVFDDRFGGYAELASGSGWGDERGVTAIALRSDGPLGRDRDQDGIFDRWEEEGVDVDCDGTVDFTPVGADPDRKNVYVEMDYMENHVPNPDAVDDVIDAFANAPVSVGNADGSPGVILRIDVDEQIPEQLDITTWTDADTIRAARFGTPAERLNPQTLAAKALIYRYALIAHTRDGGNSSGRAKRGMFVVTLGGSPWDSVGGHNVGSRAQQAGTIMHELGHTLGLAHGGDEGTNCKPNYLSVMNYSFQTRLIPNPSLPGPRLDYSREELPDLDESALIEAAGVGDGTDNTFWGFDGVNRLIAPGMGPINWSGNVNPDGTPIFDIGPLAADINFTPTTACAASPGETLGGYDDWANLRLAMRSSDGDPDDTTTFPDDELTAEDAAVFEACAANEDTARCTNPPWEYAAKFVCGRQDDAETLRLTRGLYGTTINIHNPDDPPARFFKKVAVAYPPAAQRAGDILQMGEDTLLYDEALKVDCEDIRRTAFGGAFPEPYVEGFLVVQSFRNLDVTGVYTTAALGPQGGAGPNASIDVETIPERPKGVDLRIEKQAEPFVLRFGDREFHFILYTVDVMNGGPATATDVRVRDELVLSLTAAEGVATLLPFPLDLPAGAALVGIEQASLTEASAEFTLGDIAPGVTRRLRFWAYGFAQAVAPQPVAFLTDTVSVRSGETDLIGADNTADAATLLVP
jgi:hypothetical protein